MDTNEDDSGSDESDSGTSSSGSGSGSGSNLSEEFDTGMEKLKGKKIDPADIDDVTLLSDNDS